MRRLTDLYPDVADKVDIYAVSIDVTATLEEHDDFSEQLSLTFPIVYTGAMMVPDFDVRRQATKIAFDANGIIIFRANYGEAKSVDYENLLSEMAASVADTES